MKMRNELLRVREMSDDMNAPEDLNYYPNLDLAVKRAP